MERNKKIEKETQVEKNCKLVFIRDLMIQLQNFMQIHQLDSLELT